jgi:hypothetical protein
MFQFPAFASLRLFDSAGDGRLTLHQLSDSEIPGSKPVSGSPRLIAAAHVLHRLSTPRHPPYALSSLTVSLRHERVFIETKVLLKNLKIVPREIKKTITASNY